VSDFGKLNAPLRSRDFLTRFNSSRETPRTWYAFSLLLANSAIILMIEKGPYG
jgi:hypothetical protein